MGDNAKTIRLTMTAGEVEYLSVLLEANRKNDIVPIGEDETELIHAMAMLDESKIGIKLQMAMLRSQL